MFSVGDTNICVVFPLSYSCVNTFAVVYFVMLFLNHENIFAFFSPFFAVSEIERTGTTGHGDLYLVKGARTCSLKLSRKSRKLCSFLSVQLGRAMELSEKLVS